MAIVILKDLLNSDNIPRGLTKDLLDDGEELLVGRGSLGFLLPLSPQDPSNGVAGDLKDLADLPDPDASLRKTQNGLLGLLSNDHDPRTS